MGSRLLIGIKILLLAYDQLWAVWIRVPVWVLIGGERPSEDETISSWVGRYAAQGRGWAVIAERIIDRLFVLVGAPPEHCRRSIEALYLGERQEA